MAQETMNSKSECAFITGGNGNIGRLVADQLLARGQQVVKFDMPGTEPEQTHENETIVSGDIRDSDLLKKIVSEHQPDSIYHLASLLSGSSEVNLSDTWAINATASFNLMNLALESGIGTCASSLGILAGCSGIESGARCATTRHPQSPLR